jgi:hypothetical protein
MSFQCRHIFSSRLASNSRACLILALHSNQGNPIPFCG